jgi:hypothetical protein
VNSHSKGESFELWLTFETPITTVVGKRYTMSMYTIFNCQTQGCDIGQDSLSIRIKEGDNGAFNEVGNINGRSLDTKWIQNMVTFRVNSNKINVY